MGFRVGLGINDVLADYSRGFTQFHNASYGTGLAPEHVYLLDTVMPKKELARRKDEFYSTPHSVSLGRLPGSKRGVAALSMLNELVIVTSRPRSSHIATLRWLHPYGDVFEDMHFSEPKGMTKAKIARMQRLDVVIEHRVAVARDCLDHGIPVILLNQPWNEKRLPKSSYLMRVQSWNEIPALVSNL